MGDHSTGKFVARALASKAKQELSLPDVDTVPGTKLDWQTTGTGTPAPIEHRLTRLESRQGELARVAETIDKEVRSMRAEQIRMREILARANVLNEQVADALSEMAKSGATEESKIEALRRWRAQLTGIAIGAGAVISAVAWLIERAVK